MKDRAVTLNSNAYTSREVLAKPEKGSALTFTKKLGLKTQSPHTDRRGEDELKTFPALPQISVYPLVSEIEAEQAGKKAFKGDVRTAYIHHEETPCNCDLDRY